jgi:hypothetical protein
MSNVRASGHVRLLDDQGQVVLGYEGEIPIHVDNSLGLRIWRLDPGSSAIASRGPHLFLPTVSTIMLRMMSHSLSVHSKSETVLSIRGDKLGSTQAVGGLALADGIWGSQDITEVVLRMTSLDEVLSLHLSGKVAKPDEGDWPYSGKAGHGFDAVVNVPVDQAPYLLFGVVRPE